MIETINFSVYARPTPQGSLRGFVIPGKKGAKPRAIVTSDNKKLKPYRQEVSGAALEHIRQICQHQDTFAGKHIPVRMELDFYFAKPNSVNKKRLFPVVKPDLDKLVRSTTDALTGILFCDDAQIVELVARKHYGVPERVGIKMQIAAEKALGPITDEV